MFDLFGRLQLLSNETLTVRQQARVEAAADGTIIQGQQLYWATFFPRVNARSIRISDLRIPDNRPVADRREWGQRGRLITLKGVEVTELVMVPIEAYIKYGEEELQELLSQNSENVEMVLRAIAADIPGRTDVLADADYRRLELDAFEAWAHGRITARNPQTGKIHAAPLEIDAARYPTEATAWTGGAGGSAFENFLAMLVDARGAIGNVRAGYMRYTTALALKTSAPQIQGRQPTMRELANMVTEEIGGQFDIIVDEESFEPYAGSGTEQEPRYRWPQGKIGFVPTGFAVGNTHFAPVVRAQLFSDLIADGAVDVRGVTVFHEIESNGRELTVEAQLNALPVPDEGRVYVADVGI